jgi:hypothetical protein
MSDGFWDVCKASKVRIEMTVYPPMENKVNELISLSKNKGVEVWFHKKASFTRFINLAGNSDIKEGFARCRQKMGCPMLRHGRIYYCFLPAVIDTFNKHFQAKLPDHGFVDIYAPRITGDDVIKLLEVPSQICAYCTGGWVQTPTKPWAKSKNEINERVP